MGDGTKGTLDEKCRRMRDLRKKERRASALAATSRETASALKAEAQGIEGELGYAEAAEALGQAALWLERAAVLLEEQAEVDHVDALQATVDVDRALGEGVPLDLAEAVAWAPLPRPVADGEAVGSAAQTGIDRLSEILGS